MNSSEHELWPTGFSPTLELLRLLTVFSPILVPFLGTRALHMYCMGHCLMLRHIGAKKKRACLVDMERRCLEGPPVPTTETSLEGFCCPVEDTFPGVWMLPFGLHCVSLHRPELCHNSVSCKLGYWKQVSEQPCEDCLESEQPLRMSVRHYLKLTDARSPS